MESYDEFYKGICRICLTYRSNENMVRLTDSENGLSCYGKAVEKFANISIKINDGLPSSMCIKCLLMLKQAIHFKFQCESSDKSLSVLYQQHIESECNLKEIVVDFSLFKQNFPQDFAEIPSTNIDDDKSSCVSDEVSQKCDSSDEEFSQQNENNINDVQEDTNCDSADEMLDILEKNVMHFSDLSKNEYIGKKRVRKNRKIHRHPEKQIKQQKRRQKVPINEKYVCKICQKVLANPGTLQYHMQRHNGFKYICEQCGKGFPVLVHLRIHLITRHGIGPSLQCPHCPYKAPKKFLLTEHVRLHTGERPYTCDKCGLTFRRIALWRRHMVHHGEKTVQCPHCPKMFYKLEHMKRHSNNIHERMYVYMCHKCNTTYAQSKNVRIHLLERHGIPRELQGKIIRINKGTSTGFPEK